MQKIRGSPVQRRCETHLAHLIRNPMTPQASPSPPRPALILYATMTGNTEEAVALLTGRLAGAGIPFEVEEMAAYDPHRLAGVETALLLTSTFGNGDPPDSAFAFWGVLRVADDLDLRGLRYSVLALGDSSYPRFCQFGRDLHDRLGALGGRQLTALQTCDVDWETPCANWQERVLKALIGEAGPR